MGLCLWVGVRMGGGVGWGGAGRGGTEQYTQVQWASGKSRPVQEPGCIADCNCPFHSAVPCPPPTNLAPTHPNPQCGAQCSPHQHEAPAGAARAGREQQRVQHAGGLHIHQRGSGSLQNAAVCGQPRRRPCTQSVGGREARREVGSAGAASVGCRQLSSRSPSRKPCCPVHAWVATKCCHQPPKPQPRPNTHPPRATPHHPPTCQLDLWRHLVPLPPVFRPLLQLCRLKEQVAHAVLQAQGACGLSGWVGGWVRGCVGER